MLKIFNELKPFFEDNYRRINVREYSRIRKISPPSASKLLGRMEKKGLLKKENERNYIYYFANKESELFIDLSKIYWAEILRKLGLIDNIKKLITPVIILFGSLNKAEVKGDSDVDLAIFTLSKKEINIQSFEKKLKRKIQIFRFKTIKDVKNKDLLNNILNGFVIGGNG